MTTLAGSARFIPTADGTADTQTPASAAVPACRIRLAMSRRQASARCCRRTSSRILIGIRDQCIDGVNEFQRALHTALCVTASDCCSAPGRYMYDIAVLRCREGQSPICPPQNCPRGRPMPLVGWPFSSKMLSLPADPSSGVLAGSSVTSITSDNLAPVMPGPFSVAAGGFHPAH